MRTSFSISFPDGIPSRPHPADRAGLPAPPRVLRVLEDHRPWAMMDNMVLVIVEQTYAALREILGAPPLTKDGHVEISRPVDAADPDSPLLCVNASARHCSIRLVNSSLHSGGASSTKQYRLARASVSVSPGSLHVAHIADDGSPPVECWKFADVRPNVSGKGLLAVLDTRLVDEYGQGGRPHRAPKNLGPPRKIEDEDDLKGYESYGLYRNFGASFCILNRAPGFTETALLDTIRSRLDAAIRVEAKMIEMAKASGVVKSRKVSEIVDARMALERMRAELDIDAIMRRRRQKRRRRDVQEISCWPDAADKADEAEVLVKRLRTLHVSRNRCQPAAVEMVQVNDADVLIKWLGALLV
ncbi:hypothetical protein EJB05_53527, partial [Eragrostis curvula]